MGQQQLLLLVLSTVIVGLATVAGIQAFSENQAQADQDALTQKGVTIASDIRGLASKPSTLGGVCLGGEGCDTAASASDIATKLGYESKKIGVDGASSSDAQCEIGSASGGTVSITCSASNAPENVTVSLDPDAAEPITTTYGSTTDGST